MSFEWRFSVGDNLDLIYNGKIFGIISRNVLMIDGYHYSCLREFGSSVYDMEYFDVKLSIELCKELLLSRVNLIIEEFKRFVVLGISSCNYRWLSSGLFLYIGDKFVGLIKHNNSYYCEILGKMPSCVFSSLEECREAFLLDLLSMDGYIKLGCVEGMVYYEF